MIPTFNLKFRPLKGSFLKSFFDLMHISETQIYPKTTEQHDNEVELIVHYALYKLEMFLKILLNFRGILHLSHFCPPNSCGTIPCGRGLFTMLARIATVWPGPGHSKHAAASTVSIFTGSRGHTWCNL